MNKIAQDIFKAIHQGKWISIEYKNKSEKTTNYWIGIKKIDTNKQMLTVDGLNIGTLELAELRLYYSSIKNTAIIDGSYYPVNNSLVKNIENCPSRYSFIFQNITNLKLLDYLSECNKLDNTPYKKDYSLIDELDLDVIGKGELHLSEKQFSTIVKKFNNESRNKNTNMMPRINSLCMNVCSIHTKDGIYVLAYKKLLLDVKERTLRQDNEISLCSEFTVDGVKKSIHFFLDADEYDLLSDFSRNCEKIKDAITSNCPECNGVDDMPYIMAISRDCKINLDYEYQAIMKMYSKQEITYPIQAFFGDLNAKPRRIKDFPLALYNDRVNLDQLLAIHHGIKYPVLYVQGPPGSGKTNTILNTVITAFFNGKTILLSSYNNHPIDEIYNKLSNLKYKDSTIPFPIIRLGNKEKLRDSILQIRNLYQQAAKMKVYDSSLEKKHIDEQNRTKRLSDLLRKYEEKLDLIERKAMIETMLSSSDNIPLMMNLQGQQLNKIDDNLSSIGEISDKDIVPLIQQDRTELLKFLHFTSAKFIKHLSEPKNKDLLDIILTEDLDQSVEQFSKYLSSDEKFQKFIKIFPIIATTNMSAHKLGKPKTYFDMVIIDEASQCNTAVSLVPIIRGKQLMLVGDPQQLQPVILLDKKDNEYLKKKYNVSDEYDYLTKSIYQVFLAADAVSDEVLLSYHYRCHPKIIDFNNRKYYNRKLRVKSKELNDTPLEFFDCKSDLAGEKNTNDIEAHMILQYIKANPKKTIGVITPFVNQKNKILSLLEQYNINNASCGTVHAFQGDEKQEIIFSLALSKRTNPKTYNWLKNNKELINVATSRAQEKLIIIGDKEQLDRLHNPLEDDDLYELCEYVRLNGKTRISERVPVSRALGIKPYSTETETAFLENLNHAISSMLITKTKYVVQKEIAISQVFSTTTEINDLFYTGRFDYVVYEKVGTSLYPVLAIELDGNEHFEDEKVKERDRKKQFLCQQNNFQLIRVPNNYARRYHYIKEILSSFFEQIK
ncbi:MAG: DUF2726 domain-containing protein [Ruminococcaceae bacterium]|nr:DUF2726 domain-containing protein [Oscillospiraceae bacterium]